MAAATAIGACTETPSRTAEPDDDGFSNVELDETQVLHGGQAVELHADVTSADVQTAWVSWGDRTMIKQSVSAESPLNVSHIYQRAGHVSVEATLCDADDLCVRQTLGTVAVQCEDPATADVNGDPADGCEVLILGTGTCKDPYLVAPSTTGGNYNGDTSRAPIQNNRLFPCTQQSLNYNVLGLRLDRRSEITIINNSPNSIRIYKGLPSSNACPETEPRESPSDGCPADNLPGNRTVKFSLDAGVRKIIVAPLDPGAWHLNIAVNPR